MKQWMSTGLQQFYDPSLCALGESATTKKNLYNCKYIFLFRGEICVERHFQKSFGTLENIRQNRSICGFIETIPKLDDTKTTIDHPVFIHFGGALYLIGIHAAS
jgi:hypothetical protein